MGELKGPLSKLRVVELASDHAAYAGKMLADLGAEVILVEPPGGHASRDYEPFVDDIPDRERSLWWWHYQTSKLGVVLDLEDPSDAERFRRLVRTADVVLEGEMPGRLAELGLDAEDLRAEDPRLIWVSLTGFGRDNPRRDEQFTDLTVLAGGGQVWMSGYDDHTLPPVHWGGNQGYQIGAVWAVKGALSAVLYRKVSGLGQVLDVSLHAAANVTTEQSNVRWLVARQTVQRLTCRHARPKDVPSEPTLAMSADGKWVHTGFPSHSPRNFEALAQWLDRLGLRDEFPDMVLLELGAAREPVSMADVGVDAQLTEIMRAGREAMILIASRLPATEFFETAQQLGITCGPIWSPEEALENVHTVARDFPTILHHDKLDRDVTYPGAPFIMHGSPWRLSRPAPHLGEHQHLVDGLSA